GGVAGVVEFVFVGGGGEIGRRSFEVAGITDVGVVIGELVVRAGDDVGDHRDEFGFVADVVALGVERLFVAEPLGDAILVRNVHPLHERRAGGDLGPVVD